MKKPHTSEETLANHGEFARRVARQILRDLDGADDVAQDAALAALEGPSSRGRGWIRGAVRHLAHGTIRSRAERRWFERDAARSRVALESGRASSKSTLEACQRVAAAARNLHEPYRSAVVRRYLQDESFEEIAQGEGVTPAAIRKRVSRGLELLRRRLENELDGSPGGLRVALAPLVVAHSTAPRAAAAAAIVLAVGGATYLAATGMGLGSQRPPSTTGEIPIARHEPAENDTKAASSAGPASLPDAPLQRTEAGIPGAAEDQIAVLPVDHLTGSPVRAARGWALVEGATEELRTDSASGALLVPSAATAFAVRAPWHRWAWSEAPMGPDGEGPQTIELQAPPSVTVRALVDGQPTPTAEALDVSVGRALGGAVPRLEGCPPELVTATTRDDEFEVRETSNRAQVAYQISSLDTVLVHPTAGFRIRNAPGATEFRSDSAVLDYGTPEAVLHLHKNLGLSGRVLWEQDRTAVDAGFVEVAVLYGDGAKSYRTSAQLGPDGSFAMAAAGPWIRPRS